MEVRAAFLSEYRVDYEHNPFLSRNKRARIYFMNHHHLIPEGKYFELKLTRMFRNDLKSLKTLSGKAFQSYVNCYQADVIGELCDQMFIIDEFANKGVVEYEMTALRSKAPSDTLVFEAPTIFTSKIFSLGNGEQNQDVLVQFVSPEQTEIRIKTSNNFFIDISWVRFEGKYAGRPHSKINDGPYILSFSSSYQEKLKLGDLRFKKRHDYFVIEADCYQRNYGTLEIRLYLNSDPSATEENMFRIEFRHNIKPISSKIYHEKTSLKWH